MECLRLDPTRYEYLKKAKARIILSGTHTVMCTVASIPRFQKLWESIMGKPPKVYGIMLDEAAATPEALCSHLFREMPGRIAMIGDHMQLPPNVGLSSRVKDFDSIQRSFMQRSIDAGIQYAVLSVQYRMTPRICRVASTLFYNGQLVTSSDLVRPAPPFGTDLDWYNVEGI